LHVRAVRCSGALACVGSGDHTGRLIQFLFSTELCPWITFGGQVSGHHCRSGVHKAGVCVGWVWHALQGSAQGLMYWAIALEDLRLPALGHARRRSWASKHREVHSLDCLPAGRLAVSGACRERFSAAEKAPLSLTVFLAGDRSIATTDGTPTTPTHEAGETSKRLSHPQGDGFAGRPNRRRRRQLTLPL
jgi:hypothetical protein